MGLTKAKERRLMTLTNLVCSTSGLYPLSDAGDLEMALLVQQLLVGEPRL